jgi:hypothetical protein
LGRDLRDTRAHLTGTNDAYGAYTHPRPSTRIAAAVFQWPA